MPTELEDVGAHIAAMCPVAGDKAHIQVRSWSSFSTMETRRFGRLVRKAVHGRVHDIRVC